MANEKRCSPAELVGQSLSELEARLTPLLENEFGGQSVLEAIREQAAALVEQMGEARWPRRGARGAYVPLPELLEPEDAVSETSTAAAAHHAAPAALQLQLVRG